MAVSFDAATAGGTVTAASHTFSHTVSGLSLPYLLVGIAGSTSTDLVTGVTYNGVAMTQLAKILQGTGGSSRNVYLYGLLSPAAGTHDVVVSASGSMTISAAAASYLGVSAVGTPATNAIASNATGTASVTTTRGGSWVAGFFKNDLDATVIAGTATTLRVAETTSGAGFCDNNAGVNPPALTTLTLGPQGGATAWSNIALELQAAVASMLAVF